MENAQKQVNPDTNLNQATFAPNPISNRKGNFLLIIGVALIIFMVGIATYILGTRQNKTSNISNNAQSPNQQITPSNAPTQTSLNPVINNFRNIEKIGYIKDGDVYIYDLKTKETKRLTNYGFNSGAIVAPNNTKVAFLSTPESIKTDVFQKRYGVNNIWIINTDGTNPVQVTKDIKKRGGITWSADSSKVAYEETGAIVEYSLNNKNKTTIVSSGSSPVYSPSSSYLVYLTDDSHTIVIKLPAGEKRINRANRVDGLSWSQSEDKIFYTSLDQKGQIGNTSLGLKFSIWAYSISEGKEMQITDDSLNISSPTISPDGIYLMVQQGSGYADAGNIDLKSFILKTSNDLSIIQQVKLEDFKGPSFFEKEKQYVFPDGKPVWLNNKEFVIFLNELGIPEQDPHGLYKLNVEALTAERLFELRDH